MNKLNEFLDKNYRKIFFFLLIVIFVNTCSNPNKSVNKRLDTLSQKIDSLEKVTVTKKELQIEGLKAEKRMIQSTDRKMLDVQRQTTIDAEIKKLEEVK
jgi:ABC-type phosphate transport system auxiliary subunit